MTDFETVLPMFTQSKHEEEIFTLRRQLRSQEAEWKKNKAVLEQRIEILELQNRELKEREDNLKKMNNSIFGALKDFNKENEPSYGKLIKEQEITKNQMSKDYTEYKIRSQEIIKNFEKENRELKEKIGELEIKYNQIILTYEKNDASLQQRVQSLEEEKKNLNSVIRLYEEERKQYRDKESDLDEYKAKLTEFKGTFEKSKELHRKEIDRLHYDYTETISDLKSFQQSERQSLESQIHKLLDSKKLDGNLFQDLKKNYEGQINLLMKERDNIFKKNEGLESQITQVNESVKALESRVADQKNEHERENKELKKLKLKVVDNEIQLKKYEQSEKGLKQIILEKEQRIEEVISEYKKKLQNEKKRTEQVNELVKKYKEEGEKKNALTIQENLKKDEQIKKLQNQLKNRANKEDRLLRKLENETNKSNTSIVDISAFSKSISNTKFNPSRSYMQDIKSSRDFGSSKLILQNKKSQAHLSRDFTLKNLGKDSHREILNTNEDEGEDDESEEEEDPKDLTNENILLGLNSPRPMNTINSYRNHPSNKKDTELSITSLNKLNSHTTGGRNGIQPTLTIDLCDETEGTKTTDEENNGCFTRKDRALIYKSNDGIFNFSNCSIETKKKNPSLNNLDFEFQDRKTSNPLLGYNHRKNTIEGNENKGMLYVSDFDEGHLTSSVQDFNKNSLCINPSFSQISRQNTNITQQSLCDFNDNKENYPDNRVKYLEGRLRESEHRSEKVTLEKERLQVELDRLILELKQTKMEWALSEESKEESELALKNEIKFLLNKLLEIKNGGALASSSHSDLSQFTKSTFNKSTIDPHSTSFNNTSSSLNLTHYHHPAHSVSYNSNYHEQHNMTIIKNNLKDKEKKNHETTEKKFLNPPQKSFAEKSCNPTPLREKNLKNPRFETMGDSPRRDNDLHTNENSLLMSLINMGSNAKKLIGTLKR